ncbi:MAG: ABC transporter substrate-binding protein, partial [Hyphomicrobiales bacterium]
LDNVKVREAIAHAINRQDIIDGAMSGFGIPIGSFFPPGDANYIDLTAQSNFDLTIISHTEPNDISIFSRPDYYFGYKSDAFNKIIADLAVTADPAKRSELYKAAQQKLADDYAVGFLFELPKIGVENAKLHGLWENAPAQATDLTAVYWDE